MILFSNFSYSQSVPSGREILDQMHEKWEGKWGKNMRFDQNVYHYKNDSLVKEDVWQEILSSPKNLQIRFGGFETGNGILFRNDSVYHFTEGELTQQKEQVHHLLLLGFDVFFLPPAETEEKLETLGFDLSATHERTEGEKTYYVVGSSGPEDTSSSQFWIDKENLYLHKVLLNRDSNISEVEMGNYEVIEGYPVATHITFRTNGEVTMVEKYFDVSFPDKVDPEIFDPENFNNLKW